jgi:acyl carrier protein
MTMTSQAIALPKPQVNQVVNTISWTLNVAPQRLLPYTDFVDDLHLDDIDMMLLIAALESHLKVYLTPEEVSEIKTVGDATRYFSMN